MSDLPVDPTITIRAETLLVDPNTCKFTVSRTVHLGARSSLKTRNELVARPLSSVCSRFLALRTCS